MTDWVTIPLGAKCYQPRSGRTSIERLVNLYVEPSQPNAKTPYALHGTPGLKPWTTVGDGPIRGIYPFGSDLYVVSGETLYAIDTGTKMPLEIGTVSGNGRVRMVDNGEHVAVAAAVHLYAANRSTIIELPQQYINGLAYQDGYVVFSQRGTENVWLSGLDDLTTIDALDFTTADALPDNVVGVIDNRHELWFFGEKSIEAWYNSGDAAFPFTRSGGGIIERGCIAPGSIAKALGRIYWLGDDLIVYRNAAYQEEPVSTSDVNRLIAAASSHNSAEAFTYEQDGHTFYVLSFSDLTLVYDVTTGAWHERLSYNEPRWRIADHALTSRRQHLVADFETNDIYELDLDTYSDDGDPIVRQSIFPPIAEGAQFVFMPEMYVDAEMGVGITTGQGSAPVALLDWSDDDGRTWDGAMSASLGAIGKHRQRLTFNRLGRFCSRTFRLSTSDPVKVALLEARARVEVSQ